VPPHGALIGRLANCWFLLNGDLEYSNPSSQSVITLYAGYYARRLTESEIKNRETRDMKRATTWIPTDTPGKVFIVVERQMRRCMVCEELFTREGSRLHSDVACYPMMLSPLQLANIKECLN
jgi:hypothetical protein